MPYPRFQRARSHKFTSRSSTSLTTSSTSFVDVDTALDIVLDAQAGDVIEVGLSAVCSSSTTFGLIAFDVFTIVSAAPVNSLSNATDGVNGWRTQNPNSGNLTPVSGSAMMALVAGDISGGLVTLRLRWKVSNGADTATLYADSPSRRIHLWAKNLGPVDPN